MPTLADWHSDGSRSVLWLDFERYARRVFAGSPSTWYDDPVAWVGAVGQAQSVFGSDVVGLEVGGFLGAALDRAPQAAAEDRVSHVLSADRAAALVGELLAAARHRLASADLVLVVPGPADLLRIAGAEGEAGFEALDDVCLDLVALVRAVAGAGLAGLAVRTTARPGPDEQEALEPLVRSGQHYGWVTVLAPAHGGEGWSNDASPPFDVTLPVAGSIGSVHRLSEDYWLEGDLLEPRPRGLLVGSVPEAAVPEQVVALARALGEGA